MTAIVVAISIAAALVLAGLALAMRLGHVSAGGRFDRAFHRVGPELRRGGAAAEEQTELRRAA